MWIQISKYLYSQRMVHLALQLIYGDKALYRLNLQFVKKRKEKKEKQ